MGYKAACILVNERGPGYLGTFPKHDPQAARNLVARLGLGTYASIGLRTFETDICPKPGVLGIGAYDGAAILGSQELVSGAVTGENIRFLSVVLGLFPDAEVLVLELYSAVNYFGYAYYSRGSLRRAYAGDADHGIFIETGTPQPEEQPFFAHSMVRDGVRTFELDGETWTVDQIGENLAFAMAGRFLGKPLDQFNEWELGTEEFAKVAS